MYERNKAFITIRGVSTPKDICLRRSDTTQTSHGMHSKCTEAAPSTSLIGAQPARRIWSARVQSSAFPLMQWTERPHQRRCAERRTRAVRTRPLHGARASGRRPGPSKGPSWLHRATEEKREKKSSEGKSTKKHKKGKPTSMGTCLKKDQATVFSKWRVYRQLPKKYTRNKKTSTVGSRPLATCNTSHAF